MNVETFYKFCKKVNNKPSFDQIKKACADEFNVPAFTLDQNNLRSRKGENVKARQFAHFIAKEKNMGSLSQIGRNIGNLDHATVLHSIKSVRNIMEFDKEYQKIGNRLFKKFNINI